MYMGIVLGLVFLLLSLFVLLLVSTFIMQSAKALFLLELRVSFLLLYVRISVVVV